MHRRCGRFVGPLIVFKLAAVRAGVKHGVGLTCLVFIEEAATPRSVENEGALEQGPVAAELTMAIHSHGMTRQANHIPPLGLESLGHSQEEVSVGLGSVVLKGSY